MQTACYCVAFSSGKSEKSLKRESSVDGEVDNSPPPQLPDTFKLYKVFAEKIPCYLGQAF